MITEMGRDLQNIDDDILFAKRVIKEKLCKDADIIKYLHNDELERVGADPDDYYGVNILPFIRIPGTLDKVKNFICFSVDDIEASQYNDVMKTQYIQFQIFCHADDIDTGLGISRHDLLGYFVRDIFNHTNIIGLQFKLVYNRESVTDTNFSCRLLKFEATKPNSLSKGLRRPTPRKNDEVNNHGLIVRD